MEGFRKKKFQGTKDKNENGKQGEMLSRCAKDRSYYTKLICLFKIIIF